MNAQNINEIYAVIETQNGKEVGLMKNKDGHYFVDCAPSDGGENLKERAKDLIKAWNIHKELKKLSIGGLLVKFTNREVISVFGGEI